MNVLELKRRGEVKLGTFIKDEDDSWLMVGLVGVFVGVVLLVVGFMLMETPTNHELETQVHAWAGKMGYTVDHVECRRGFCDLRVREVPVPIGLNCGNTSCNLRGK